jgi:hypothetical protein
VDRPSKGVLVFVCDVCDESIEITKVDVSDFRRAWTEAKEEGWKIVASEHRCPDCAELD